MNFECPICLDTIKYSSVGSCMHHFCYDCLYEWCKRSNKCPICKQLILEFKIDHEFNNLIHMYKFEEIIPILRVKNLIILRPIKGIDNPGLKIKNNHNGPGVIIINVKSTGLFNFYNIKQNEIILFVNDIPCMNHKFVMEQIMALNISNKNINCIFLK